MDYQISVQDRVRPREERVDIHSANSENPKNQSTFNYISQNEARRETSRKRDQIPFSSATKEVPI
jgi:hypothetical protein